MGDISEISESSSNTTDVSLPQNTGRTQPVEEYNVNVSTVQNSLTVSNSKNVVLGNQVVEITKTDGRASNIKESTRSMLNLVDRDVYVETRAEEKGITLLKTNDVVIVIGSPGSGKTTLALSMMRKIEQEEKRESYFLTHHYEFNDISLSRNKKSVVLIDDIFGKTNLVSNFIESWKQKFPKMWNLVQNHYLKCIITLRKQIFSESEIYLKEFGVFNENHILDLQSDDCCLNYREKEEILNEYLKQKDVAMEENDKRTVIYRSYRELGFPQVCVFYVNSSNAQKRRAEFFKKPVEYFRKELEKLKSDKTLQINYLVLLLIMFKQGSLSIDSLDPFEDDTESDVMQLVRQLEQFCQNVKVTTLKGIQKAADLMCGTFLKRCDNEYTFIHQSVFDALFLMFSSKFPRKAVELLEMCPVSTLLEYVVTPGVCNESHLTMTVKPDYFDILARRFTDLLASNNAGEITSHPSLKDEDFLEYLVKKKDFYDRLSEILNQRVYAFHDDDDCLRSDERKYPYISCVHEDTADEIFRNISRLLGNDSKFNSSYTWAVKVEKNIIFSSSVPSECIVNGQRTLSRFFTSKLCEMKLVSVQKEVLDISCLFGDVDIVRLLLKEGVTPTFDTFCTAACSKTDSAAVLRELLKYTKEEKLTLCSRLLHISVCSGNMNIACLLAAMINKEKQNSEIKEKAVKMLLVRFHRQVTLEQYKTFELSHLFKKLVTIDVINKIKDILIIAVGHSNSDVTKEIVKLKPDSLNDENRDKVLLAAAVWGSTDTVNFLIEQRRNDKDENNWKKSQVLKVAVMFNTVGAVQCLLDKGADPNANVPVNLNLTEFFKEEIRSKLLHEHEIRSKEFSDDKTSLKQIDEDKCSFKLLPSDSTLHISVLRGDLDVLKSLLKKNANVNAVNSEGETPLHKAVKAVTHRKEVALLLLVNGADNKIVDKQNNSALHIASQIDIDVVKKLTKKDVEINVINIEGETPLFLALKNNRPEIASYLLKKGADPNLTDNDNNSVLHLAARQGNLEIVKALTKKEVDVNSKNEKGETSLFIALDYYKYNNYEHPNMYRHNNEVFLYLLEHGADTNLTDNDNNSVLHLAAKDGNLEIVKALIEKGIDVNIKNSYGRAPLFTAVLSEQNSVFHYLLTHGTDRNLRDNDNNSVLHIAAKYGNLEIATALIKKGFDVNSINNRGETPLFTALNYDGDEPGASLNDEKCQLVFYLLEQGADPNLTDNDNNSVLHLAAEQGNLEIVTALIEKGSDVNIKNILR